MTINKFCKSMIDDGTAEWNKFENGHNSVTIEFSCRATEVADILQYVATSDKPKNGYWKVYYCTTCANGHNSHPFHVEINRSN